MEKDTLGTELATWRESYYKGQRNWSFAHHSCLFGSIICSVVAGAILQIDKVGWAPAAAVLTSVAAVLTGIAASGGFDRKWRSNRLSRSRIDMLLLDLEKDPPDLESVRTGLKETIQNHDVEIVADKSGGRK